MRPHGWKGHPHSALKHEMRQRHWMRSAGNHSTKDLTNPVMLVPLVWYVFNCSEAHDSKEVTKLVASLVIFF